MHRWASQHSSVSHVTKLSNSCLITACWVFSWPISVWGCLNEAPISLTDLQQTAEAAFTATAATASTCAREEKLYVIITDDEPQFTSSTFTELLKEQGVTTPERWSTVNQLTDVLTGSAVCTCVYMCQGQGKLYCPLRAIWFAASSNENNMIIIITKTIT